MLSAQANSGHCQDTDDAHCIMCGVAERLDRLRQQLTLHKQVAQECPILTPGVHQPVLRQREGVPEPNRDAAHPNAPQSLDELGRGLVLLVAVCVRRRSYDVMRTLVLFIALQRRTYRFQVPPDPQEPVRFQVFCALRLTVTISG
jgi:hypothetical protein